MQRETVSRRALLAATAPIAAGLAGCSGGGSGTDGGDDDGGQSRQAERASEDLASFPSLSPGEPSFREWVPGGDADVGFDAAHNIGRIRRQKGNLPASEYEERSQWAMLFGYVGIEYGELEGVLVGLGTGVVYTGSFSRGDIESRLGETRFEAVGTQGGVSYYRRPSAERPTFLGVGERGVFLGRVDADADSPRRAFADRASVLFETARGERPRLHEESGLYRRYTDAVGWPLVALARPPVSMGGRMRVGGGVLGREALSEDLRSSVRYGTGRYVADGSLVERFWLYVGKGASPSEVRAVYGSEDVRNKLDGEESLAVRRDGRVVDVARITPVSDAGGGADPVLASLSVSLDGGTATITHVAGEAVPLGRLTIRAGDETVAVGNGTLDPGGSVTVDVPDGTEEVRVVYSAPHTDGASTVVAETG